MNAGRRVQETCSRSPCLFVFSQAARVETTDKGRYPVVRESGEPTPLPAASGLANLGTLASFNTNLCPTRGEN